MAVAISDDHIGVLKYGGYADDGSSLQEIIEARIEELRLIGKERS